jgi:transposase
MRLIEPHANINLMPTLGRKNWLFCGNHDSGENAAIIYSMLGCCKAYNVNFRDWLIYFLNNIHNFDNRYDKDLADLLPHNFSKITAEPTPET